MSLPRSTLKMTEPLQEQTCKESDSFSLCSTDHESELSQQWDLVDPIGSQSEEAQTHTKHLDRCVSHVSRRIQTWDQQDPNSYDNDSGTTRKFQVSGCPLSPPSSTTETTNSAVPGIVNIGNEANNQMIQSERTRNVTNDAQSALTSNEEQDGHIITEYANEVPLWGTPSPRTAS